MKAKRYLQLVVSFILTFSMLANFVVVFADTSFTVPYEPIAVSSEFVIYDGWSSDELQNLLNDFDVRLTTNGLGVFGSLTVPRGRTLVVDGGSFTVHGTLNVKGTIINEGQIHNQYHGTINVSHKGLIVNNGFLQNNTLGTINIYWLGEVTGNPISGSGIVATPGPAFGATMQEIVDHLLLDYAGVSALAFRTGNNGIIDRNILAQNVGILDGVNYQPSAVCSPEDFVTMLLNAFPLYEAMRRVPMEPFFVNGMAQPIFPMGGNTLGITNLDTTGEGVARFVVFVETDLDTDGDGELDLVKVLVQIPRAAVDQGMQVGTIFHAQPYNEGTIGGTTHPVALRNVGQAWLDEHGTFYHHMLHGVAEPRVAAGVRTTAEMVAAASVDCGLRDLTHEERYRCDCPWKSWNYLWQAVEIDQPVNVLWGRPNGNQMGSRTAYDYFLTRGFAHVTSAGLGQLEGDGHTTYGTDVEINAYKAVIDWLNGNARAFASRDCNIEVFADWSNGKVGMHGVSYGGSTPLGIATTGVQGLKTIVPENGVVTYYDYQNSQGGHNWNAQYTPGLAGFTLSAAGRADWMTSDFRLRQLGYMQQMLLEAIELNAAYGEHWRLRDYTVENWDGLGRGWGPSRVQASMLIVAGANDPNVMPQQSMKMWEIAQTAGVEARHIINQGAHASLNGHLVNTLNGDFVFQDLLNKWFSYHLFGYQNGVLDILPPVLAHNNITGEFEAYAAWEEAAEFILDSRHVGRADFPELNLTAQSTFVAADGNIIDMYPDSDSLLPILPVIIEENEEFGIESFDAGMLFASLNEDLDPERFIHINSAVGGTPWATHLNGHTPGSMLWSTVLEEDMTIQGVTTVNFSAAIMSAGSNVLATEATIANFTNPPGQARVFARLVEVAAPGTYITSFGTNITGNGPGTHTLETGGLFRGGGLAPLNVVRHNRVTNLTHREVARGFMNLAFPESGWASYTVRPEERLNIAENLGVFHDYTLYFQPNVHTVSAGNMLVLILGTGHVAGSAHVGNRNYTGVNAFTFAVDTANSNIVIPITEAVGGPSTPLERAAGIAERAANAHFTATRPNTVTRANVTTMGNGILNVVRSALVEEDFDDITVSWIAPFAGEVATAWDPSIMAGTLQLLQGTERIFVPLFWEVQTLPTLIVPEWYTNRSVVPRVPEGQPFAGLAAPRDQFERDIFEAITVAGPKMWGTPNEQYVSRYLFDRFSELAAVANRADGPLAGRRQASAHLVAIPLDHTNPPSPPNIDFTGVSNHAPTGDDVNPFGSFDRVQNATAARFSFIDDPAGQYVIGSGDSRTAHGHRLNDYYGLWWPRTATPGLVDSLNFQGTNSATLVDLGTYPNLSVPIGTTGDIAVTLRFGSAHLEMEHQLLPIIERLNENPDFEIRLVVLARHRAELNPREMIPEVQWFNMGRRLWSGYVPQLNNRPQDKPGNTDNELNHGMYNTVPGHEVFGERFPFVLVSHAHLTDIEARNARGLLSTIERYERTHMYSPLLILPATENPEEPELVLFMASHMDSVAHSHGIGDSTGGALTMLHAARQLAGENRGRTEIWILPYSGHEEGMNAGTEVHYRGGSATFASMVFESQVRRMMSKTTASGISYADIAIVYSFDMTNCLDGGRTSPNFRANVGIAAGSRPGWSNPAIGTQGNVPSNLSGAVFWNGAREIPIEMWRTSEGETFGRTTINNGGAGEAGTMARDLGVMGGGMSNGTGLFYHTAWDHLDYGYCYYRMRHTAEIFRHGLLWAFDNEASRVAHVNFDRTARTLNLTNAAQLFNTYDRVEGNLLIGTHEAIPFEFDRPIASFVIPTDVIFDEDTPIAVKDILAFGTAISGVTYNHTANDGAGSLQFTGDRRFYSRMVSNLMPTPEHLHSRLPGTRIHAGMIGMSGSYRVNNPFVRVDGVGYIANRVFVDLIGGRQNFSTFGMNPMVHFGEVTVSGQHVDGDFVTVRVPEWRTRGTDALWNATTYWGWWTNEIAPPTHAFITKGDRPEVSVLINPTGTTRVHVQSNNAYLPLSLLAEAFGFEVKVDGDGYILYVASDVTTNPITIATNNVLANDVTATAVAKPTEAAEGDYVAVTITLTGTAAVSGTHTVGLIGIDGIMSPATTAINVESGQVMDESDEFLFTFIMPATAVDSLEVIHTFEASTFTANFISIWETGRNSRIWEISFSVIETFADGTFNQFESSIHIPGANANLSGAHTFEEGSLTGRTLVFDIRNNGNDIRVFDIR